MPVYSVETKEEAEQLLMLVGRKQYTEHPKLPDQPWMKITLDGELDFKPYLDMDDLPAVEAKLHQAYQIMQQRKEEV